MNKNLEEIYKKNVRDLQEQNRNLMVNPKESSRNSTYPNPPRIFKLLHESLRISQVTGE